ncbi:METTL5 family protein [Archaeoglobus profundus]|uniref:Methyltransferase small n=1 Tax=Archaeoglobus profundus (strain DSM 5631 / JCM 9629 / NBRC 100127 / Av18) TaxID=572546 RepID=D2RHL3_ARCPA|nr:METTL5 family protein [Archaeoglobus profundus]ADB57788.1 methyltransferase small [Archaeoglobus profundus DSM 5631]
MKKSIEIALEKLKGFENPKIELEQYVTPPALASEIVVNAKLISDLDNLVVDLGCGTGILSIASSLLGAEAVGFDIDREALRIARENARAMEVEADFVLCSVEKVYLKVPPRNVTVIMNPPFGIQKRHADRPFLFKAMEIANVIWTIHSAGSEKFIRKICKEKGFEVTHLFKLKIPLKRTYSFHEKPYRMIAVEVYRMERYI